MSLSEWLVNFNAARTGLERPERVLLSTLATSADNRTCECRVTERTQKRVGEWAECDRDRIAQAVETCVASGWMKLKQWDGREGMPCVLTLPQETREAPLKPPGGGASD